MSWSLVAVLVTVSGTTQALGDNSVNFIGNFWPETIVWNLSHVLRRPGLSTIGGS